MYDILELSKMLLPELREIAKELKIKRAESLKKQDLVYKILDQQAIEATENKNPQKKENDTILSMNNKFNQDQDPGQRRGKRPRTSKPVFNRPVESVMSVTPDDLTKNGSPSDEWKEQSKTQEKTEVKPDLFKPLETSAEEKKVPFWMTEMKIEDRSERTPKIESQPEDKAWTNDT